MCADICRRHNGYDKNSLFFKQPNLKRAKTSTCTVFYCGNKPWVRVRVRINEIRRIIIYFRLSKANKKVILVICSHNLNSQTLSVGTIKPLHQNPLPDVSKYFPGALNKQTLLSIVADETHSLVVVHLLIFISGGTIVPKSWSIVSEAYV